MSRPGIFRTLSISFLPLCLVLASPSWGQRGATDGEWRYYGADSGGTKYSSLGEIDSTNVKDLEIVWRWNSPDNAVYDANPAAQHLRFEATPLMVDGVLYVSTGLSQAAAIEGATGKTIWVYDPESWKAGRPANVGFVHRGLTYWSDGRDERIFFGTGDARLIALDAKTGQPVPDFGEKGSIDLLEGLRVRPRHGQYSVSSPPVVCRDVLIVGSSISDGATTMQAPPGDIRGFDVRTGEQRWIFHSIPQEGEFGNDTWEDDSWKYTGNTNVWTTMSADQELGYVYLPFGTPTDDWYGGHRPGDNLFAESLVCLDAETGERVWHFQMIHHGLWDYDLPTAPALVDITVDGRRIRALAQVSKQGFCYVLDRVTGDPVWPIEERPVPQSTAEGEQSSPTQPFPTKPPAFERQGLSPDDLIDFTPELHAEALEILSKYDHGPLYTPPTERGTINLPGWVGGANWSGAAVDPETGILYVPSITVPLLIHLVKPDPNRSNLDYIGRPTTRVDGPRDLPLIKPPYSRVTAIDLNQGTHKWQIALGDGPREHPAIKKLNLPPLGSGSRGFPMVTKSLLFVAQEAFLYSGSALQGEEPETPHGGRGDGRSTLRAFDKATGELIHEIDLPGNVTASPMTYMLNGKQYIVMAKGGISDPPAELIAYALP